MNHDCDLARKHCIPCKGGVSPLSAEEQGILLQKLPPGWQIPGNHHLEKTFSFPDFQSALAFTNRAGDIAEAENHHPEITLTWGRVTIRVWTHKIDGLTESDFVLAAKIDAACQESD